MLQHIELRFVFLVALPGVRFFSFNFFELSKWAVMLLKATCTVSGDTDVDHLASMVCYFGMWFCKKRQAIDVYYANRNEQIRSVTFVKDFNDKTVSQ